LRANSRLEDTERSNPKSTDIDRKSTLEIVRIISDEDRKVPDVIARDLRKIAEIVDAVVEALRTGGRVFYVGAGTSGRLGVLDASEMPPTFGVPPSMFQGIIAGGPVALRRSVEAAEDNEESAVHELKRRGFSRGDVLIGLSASGRAPFVLAASKEAKRIGARVFAVTCNAKSPVSRIADCTVVLRVGPEIIAGSSRMKCGTAQKMVLNMISTASMVRLGKAHRNVMVGLQPKSRKLRARAVRIISQIAEVKSDVAKEMLGQSGGDIRCAIVMARHEVSRRRAKSLLRRAGGDLDKVDSVIKQERLAR